MKNFSAKNAEFETLKINNEAAISSADLGTAPNQIPLNKDLGSLAYQDAVNLDDVSADMLELRAIAAEISDSAVDVFVYDTSRDSDGGAWRKRTQHTSWYNETLNTATRGARREFPAVAVIVAEAGKVTIYDGDDPDLSMWMVFEAGNGFVLHQPDSGHVASAISAINGILAIGHAGGAGELILVEFVNDSSWMIDTYESNNGARGSLVTRNSSVSLASKGSDTIVNDNVNDVAMTILPNAPIDQNTGLPVPTIAVATDGGVSVIKDDGNVVDIVYTNNEQTVSVAFNSSGNLHFVQHDNDVQFVNVPIPTQDHANGTAGALVGEIGGSAYHTGNSISGNTQSAILGDVVNDTLPNATSGPSGLTFISNENPTGYLQGAVAYATTSYNTGWMPGDIKLATLSDTTVETIGVNSDELLTNEDFVDTNSDGADDWILSNDATTSTSGTAVTITNGGVNFGYIYQVVNTEIGKQYLFSVDVDYTSNNGRILLGKDGSSTSSGLYFHEENINSDKTIEYYFTAETETLYVRIGLQNNTLGDSISFDNISVRATTELITNGDFSSGTEGWTAQEDNGTFTASNGVATIAYVTGPTSYEQYVTTVIGKTYTLSFDITAISTSQPQFYYNTGSGDVGMAGMDDTGVKTSTFVANSTSTRIWVRCPFEGNFDIDNISVRPAVDDRSVNNNGLQIVGEINKTPVAPGADLVAYSGFSANNYLVQPYNQDLDFGTGDFCVMGWFKRNSNSTYHRIWNRADSIDHHRVEFYTGTTGNEVYFYTRDDSANTVVEGTLPPGIWTYLVGVREGGTLKIYENGVLANSTTGVARDLTSENNAVLQIGESSSLHPDQPFDGSIALFRISTTVPTDAQIAKIYRDEKALFQDGAQATLYGSSDAVTALAYDDSNQLLHVGTASGRSDFRGLARVNNTTTAISNSISAAEGTIIQN